MDNQSWQSLLNEREMKELQWAMIYATDFAHGTTGHNQLMLIAKLANMLNRIEGETDVNIPKLYEPKDS